MVIVATKGQQPYIKDGQKFLEKVGRGSQFLEIFFIVVEVL